ncbi:hypothetical protein [Streptomyces griseorubiginosus]|uniref:hypothetical protein n=1 Tax=Streptomyces griseorubiginosus TaxID=67304 RepID=UPI001AD644F5|nr:hypothetical protein [Streptomyces griseorubiginosus]MBO4257741.1 hypothetical protein [Streptomyces griseorubiginosus]
MKLFKRNLSRGLLVPALALLMLPFATGTANANTSPGWGDDKPDVIWDCNHGRADSCQYHQVNAWTALGKRRQVGNTVNNCAGSSPLRFDITFRTDRSTSYSFEQQTSVEVSAGLKDTFEAGVSASVSQTEKWEVGTTTSASTTLSSNIQPHEAGGYWFAPYWRHSQGWLEVHYGKRRDGHYYWYYPGRGTGGVQITTPVMNSDGSMKGQWYWATWKC